MQQLREGLVLLDKPSGFAAPPPTDLWTRALALGQGPCSARNLTCEGKLSIVNIIHRLEMDPLLRSQCQTYRHLTARSPLSISEADRVEAILQQAADSPLLATALEKIDREIQIEQGLLGEEHLASYQQQQICLREGCSAVMPQQVPSCVSHIKANCRPRALKR